jgi:hypothetical protein
MKAAAFRTLGRLLPGQVEPGPVSALTRVTVGRYAHVPIALGVAVSPQLEVVRTWFRLWDVSPSLREQMVRSGSKSEQAEQPKKAQEAASASAS